MYGLTIADDYKFICTAYKGKSLSEALEGKSRLNDRIRTTISLLMTEDINGCITGSSLLDVDFDEWESAPDIDIFVYTEWELVNVCALLQYKHGMQPNKIGTDRSAKQEAWKFDRLKQSGVSRKIPVTTHSFMYEDIVVNVTYKMDSKSRRPMSSLVDVLSSFDMSIIMKGYDIKGRYYLDLRHGDANVATPNPLRNQDPVMWNVEKWCRQFDRVVKYWDRGFDTRPMARFYIKLIDQCLEEGCIWDSMQDSFKEFSSVYMMKRKLFADWLEEKEGER